MAELRVTATDIPGLMVVDLPVLTDERGWFKENWQRAKMLALGVPDFGPIQHNVSFNTSAGTTRGFHAEPWDKLVSVVTGRVFGAWVDLRDGESFGRTVTVELGPERAMFVPRGVANAYQTLVDGTAYSYLVNDHWSAAAKDRYTFLNLDHPGVEWPLPLATAILSAADRAHPPLAAVTPVPARRPVVTGADGQLGRALRRALPDAVVLGHAELDITDQAAVEAFDWSAASAIVNAAAHTAVDAAEGEGRAACWRVNVAGTRHLTDAARRHRLPLVTVSSDYVFDGSLEVHAESEPPSPLGAYGAAKAAADAVAATWPMHYILRTSWVVGDGPNFVRTMARLADSGASPAVVDDQLGRLTFADDLARAAVHLLDTRAPYGTYNVTSDGPARSWYDIATRIFAARNAPGTVTPVDTATYAAGRPLAPRPRHSTLDLAKIAATGFTPVDGDAALDSYLERLP